MNRISALALLCALFFCAAFLPAQVQSEGDIITPTPAVQGSGGITPYFWIGIQSIFSAGYNFETGAGGFRNHGGDDDTYASFNVAFVDSHYSTPKIFEAGGASDMWSGKFKLMNFTSRINSYSTREINNPAWLAEIAGFGAHIGFFTQAGMVIGSLDDTQNNVGSSTSANDPKPWRKISAGNKVLALGDDDLGKDYYNGYRSSALPHETVYTVTTAGKGGLMYAGYEKKDLFNVYVTALSEGNVNANLTKNNKGETPNDGFAAALDFGVSPFGLITDDEHPLTFNITGNAIGGANFETSENIGFGLKGDGGFWFFDNYVIAPVAAFDGRLDINNEFTWKAGGGLTFQLSGMRWVNDDWNEITGITNYDFRYENSQILKYAYAQAYLAYSEQTDLDMVLKFEEPDGDAGFHDKIGAMFETRLYNLTGKITSNKLDWAMQGRFSYDFSVKGSLLTPYLRAYLDSSFVTKLRLGAQANFIPYTGFEIAYTSANLNSGADTTVKPLAFYDNIKDSGRLELIVILKSDNPKPRTKKHMDEWNYSKYNY